MVKTVSFAQRVKPSDKDFLDSVLKDYMKKTNISNKGEALVHLIKNSVSQDNGAIIPEIYYPEDESFEATCPFGFLKRITDKQGYEKWHCLKQQGPDSKGAPVLLGDGEDKNSIKAICEACQINWQRGPRKLDQVRVIFEQLGDREISSKLFFCTRDALGEGIKLSTTENGSFYCTERRRKVIIKTTCIAKTCPFLVQKIVSMHLAEMVPFMEAQKALEILR